MGSSKVITFLKSPLVTWIKTFQEEGFNGQIDCSKLFDGVFLHSVWQQIETNGSFHSHTTIDETSDSIVSRIRNLSSLLYKIQTFYSDSLGQILVLKLPDVVNIGRDPEDECNLEDLGTLLLLLLGSAVQCESKERFIEAITALDLSVQHAIVECIRQITENPSSVWSNNEWGEISLIPEVDQPRMYSTLVSNVNRLAKERDDLSQRVVELILEIESLKSKGPCSVASSPHSNHPNRHHSSHHHHIPSSLPLSPNSATGSGTLLASSPPPVGSDGLVTAANPSLYNSYSSSSVSSLLTINNNESRSHLVVELAEAKSKYRKVVAELEEKSELVNELKENLEQSKETCNKLRSENLELIQEARSAKAYRDEIDVLNERVRKVDRLENEVQRYRDKINELIFYKSRVEEMREDNRILTETKTMLEEQLECSRKRSEQIPELEAQLLQLRAYSNELQFQRDMDRDKIESLMEEVASLQVEKKSVIEELAQVQKELNSLRCQYTAIEPAVSPIGLESNLFEQLNNDAAKRVLKLELENQKLHSLVENIRNKDTTTAFVMNNFKQSQQHQTSSLDSFSSSSASEKGDATSPSQLLDDGHNYSAPASGNDSGCVSLVGELNSRLEKMEKENLRLKGTIEQLRECETRIMELESAKTGQEKELSSVRDNLQKEIYKTETLERSLSNLTTENSRLTRQVENLSKRLEDCSQEIQALEGENSKLQGTASTLRNTVKRLNDLEREVTHLEAENHRLEQERKSNEKEITRLKQALEAKDSLIDEQANKVSSLELEKKQMSKELDSINANAINAKELEKEKQELAGELAVCKKSLAALRKDLVDEKIKSQSLTSEMERIHYAMSQMSLKSSSSSLSPSLISTTDDILQTFDLPTFSSANIGKIDWSNVLENLLESMIRRNLEIKETRITALENNLKEVESRKTKLKDELAAMKEKISKSQIVTDNKSLESSLDVLIEEMEKRLKVAEDENKLLRGDNLSLKESKDQLTEQVKSLQDKVKCMSRESNDLHSDTAKAQVENSLLLAQRTSLSSQTAHLQAEIRHLEECRDSIEEKYKELEESYQALLNDHQSLQSLHQQLASDYESLLDNHNSLKTSYKSLKSEHKETKEKLEVWLLSNEELKRMLKDGNDCGKCKKMAEDNTKLTDEKKQLVEDYRRIETEFKMLQNIYKQLRKENNELKLRHTELEGETAECRQSMSSLQVEVSKLSNYCESLGSSNNLLEEQRRTLLRNVLNLLSQYHLLISEMASRETDNVQSKDRIAELVAKKERLERMIRDYDTMSEREKKKIGLRSDTNGIRSSASRHSLNGSLYNEDENRFTCNVNTSNHGFMDETNPSSAFMRVISSKQQIVSPTSTSGIISNNNSSLTSPISELTSPLSSSTSTSSSSTASSTSTSTSSTLTKPTTPSTTTGSHNLYYDKPWQPLSTVNASATTTVSSSSPSSVLVKKSSTPTSLLSTQTLAPTTTPPTPLSIISRSRRETPIGGESIGVNCESRRLGGIFNDNLNSNDLPPPRLPPRHNTVTAQVDNRMTINVITSPLGNSRVPLPGDHSSLTPPLPKSGACNFVRGNFRSSSINMGSPLKRGYLKDDHGIVSTSSGMQNHHHPHYGEILSPNNGGGGSLRGHHHHHHLHLHHPHAHLHLASYSNEPSIHSDEESDLLGAITGDRLLTNRTSGAGSSNHHHHHHHHHLIGGGGGDDEINQNSSRQDDSDSTINGNNSINNSTWYEYGCV